MTKMKTPGFRMWLALPLVVAADLLPPSAAHGETRIATNLTPEAVWDAINAAQDGDIVQLPGGTVVWKRGWNAGHWARMKVITIQGAGIDKTVIRTDTTFNTRTIQVSHERSFMTLGEFAECDGRDPIDGNQIPAGQKGAGYPCFGQPGHATDADRDGVFEPSPCYAWNNTFNGAKLNMVLRPWADPRQTERQAAHVEEGRDFFNRAPEPEDYQPYRYPHPLQRAP